MTPRATYTRPFQFTVPGAPPLKDGGTSCLNQRHASYVPALELMEHARDEMAHRGFDGFGTALLRMELVLRAPTLPRGDLTNYLGGVADVLESKDKRLRSGSDLSHLGDLVNVAVYKDDRQIRDARVVLELDADTPSYSVGLWEFSTTPTEGVA